MRVGVPRGRVRVGSPSKSLVLPSYRRVYWFNLIKDNAMSCPFVCIRARPRAGETRRSARRASPASGPKMTVFAARAAGVYVS